MEGVNLGSIFASIVLDTSGLLRGVVTAKREVTSLSKQVADATKSLVIAPKVNLQSLRGLNSEMDQLKKRAAFLRGDLLTIKPTIQNPNAVKDLEHELQKVENRMQLVGKSADDLRARANRIKEIGGSVTGIGNSLTVGLTAPIAAAVTGIGLLATHTGKYAEEINNLAQETGVSTKSLQELKFVSDVAGLSFQKVTTAITMIQQKLMGVEDDSGLAAEAFTRLGIDVHDSAGNLRSMNDLFSALITRLQGMTNQTERNMLAAQIFGRGWREIAPILGMTAAEMEAARKKANDLGVVMSGSALKSAQAFDDSIDDLRQQAIGLGREMAGGVIPVLKDQLLPAIAGVLKDGGKLLKLFFDLPPVTQKTIGVFIALVAAIGPVLSLIGKVMIAAPALQSVAGFISGIGGAAAAGTTGIVAFATGLGEIALVVAAVAAAVYGLVRLIGYLSRTTADEADEASKAARKHAEDVRVKAEQAEKTRDLVREYEELRKKTNRTNEETGRMKTLLSQIRDLSPDLIKGYDSQGRAIGLLAGAYTTAAEEARKAAVAFQQAGIAAQTTELVKVKTEKERVQSELNEARRTASKGTRQVTRRVPTPASAAFGSTSGLPGGSNPLNMPGSNIFDVERKIEEPATSREQAAASRKAEQLQGQLKDIEKREKQILETRKGIARGTLPGLPGMNAPGTGKAGSGGTGGGGGGSAKSAPALPFNLSLEQARNNVAKIELEMKGLEDAFRRAIEAGDEKKSTERIGKLREGIAKLKQSYIDLRNAESVDASRTMKHDSAAAKTAQEKRDAANKAVAAIQKADIDQSANIQELRNRDRAAHDALLALRKKGSEEERRTAERTAAKMREEVESEFDIRGEAMEEERRIAEQNANTLREFDRRGREALRENTERRKRDELEFLDWEREHNLISSQAYIATLEVKLAAERQYSEEWFDLHAKIESARADEASSLVSDAEHLAETNKTAAVDLLSYWLEVYQGMGTAGVAAAEKVEAALVKLTTTGKQQAKGWYDGYKAVIDSIRVSFVDAVAGMIQHTRSFRDFMKDVWNQILRYAVNALVQMVIESAKANKQAGGSGVKGALSGIGSLLGGPVGAGFAVGTALMKFFNFDNPINDTGAVRSGADFGRLFKTGMNTTFNPDALVRNMGGAEMKPANTQTVVNNSPSFNVSVNIDKIDSDMDVNRMADNIAYLVNSKLALVPVR